MIGDPDMPPFFSVAIPLYNKAPHIKRAIDSVLAQTFRDFEIIVVDDASTDGGDKLVLQYTDTRITLMHRDTPGPGGYAARNLALCNARGRWVAFLDADDEWLPGHLLNAHVLILQYPETVLVGCGWQVDRGTGERYPSPYFAKHHDRGPHVVSCRDYLRECVSGRRAVHTSVACVRRSKVEGCELFPESMSAQRGGDLHAWLTLVCEHKSLAWSNHIGATYYTDAVNMVTATAPSSKSLTSRRVYRKLGAKLNGVERRWLRKYLNRRLRNGWANNIIKEDRGYRLVRNLYWRGDWWFAAITSLLTLLPRKVLRGLIFRQTKLVEQRTRSAAIGLLH